MTDLDNEYYWHDSDFIKYDSLLLSSLGLDKETVEVLSINGLPEWAAPNINFGFFDSKDNVLKIGEDRDENDIYIDVQSGKVLFGARESVININTKALRDTLKAYAEMVEKAISVDENSVVENQIPDDLIFEFQEKLSRIDSYAVENTGFWIKEIERCLRNELD